MGAGKETPSPAEAWDSLLNLTRALERTAQHDPATINVIRLAESVMGMQAMLKYALSQRNSDALRVAYGMTSYGCEMLENITAEDAAFVTTIAERATVWPLLMAGKQDYHDKADRALTAIRVGTKSNPRTNKGTHVSTEVQASALASMALGIINTHRTFAASRMRRLPSGPIKTASKWIAETRAAGDRSLRSKIKALPPLRKDTQKAWREVALEIVSSYWAANPTKADKDIRTIGGAGDVGSRKGAKTIARAKISSALRTAMRPYCG